MKGWKMKGCPRCGGDTYRDIDDPLEGPVQRCVQCGWGYPIEPNKDHVKNWLVGSPTGHR
jgi:hypothetical protein